MNICHLRAGLKGEGEEKPPHTPPRSKKLSSNVQNQAQSAASSHSFHNFCRADLRQHFPTGPAREVGSIRCQYSGSDADNSREPASIGKTCQITIRVRKCWVPAYVACLPYQSSFSAGMRLGQQGAARSRASAGAYQYHTIAFNGATVISSSCEFTAAFQHA